MYNVIFTVMTKRNLASLIFSSRCVPARCQDCLVKASAAVEPAPTSLDVTLLANIKGKTLTRTHFCRFAFSCKSVCLVNDSLWTCHNDGRVQVFSLELQEKFSMQNDDFGDVFNVTALPNEQIVLACSSGLFYLTPNGNVRCVIDATRSYNNVVSVGYRVYGYCPGEDHLLQYQLVRNTWYKLHGRNVLTSHRNLTSASFAASDDVYICYQNMQMVERLSSEFGDLVGIDDVTTAFMDPKHSYFPRLCAVDSQKSMLLADTEFDRLCVRDVTGSCGLVELLPAVHWLKQAVFSNGKLYVLSAGGFKLSVYSADVTALELMQQLGGQAIH